MFVRHFNTLYRLWPRKTFFFCCSPHTEFSPPSFFKVRLQDRNYQHKSEQDNNCCRCDKAGNRALLALLVIADIVVLFENRTRNQAGDGKEEGKERKPEAAGIVQRCIKDRTLDFFLFKLLFGSFCIRRSINAGNGNALDGSSLLTETLIILDFFLVAENEVTMADIGKLGLILAVIML